MKPTQSALWLRAPKPVAQRNILARGFEAVYGAVENGYARLIGAMTRRAVLMVVLALALVGVAVYGLTRIPTAFLPVEDQGYLIVPVQLPDGASKERTDAVMQKVSQIAGAVPGVDHVVTVSGISILDNRASLVQRGRRLRRPQGLGRASQGKGPGCAHDQPAPERRASKAYRKPFPSRCSPPPIQGIGNVGGFTMQVELKSGNFDYALLQTLTNAVVASANAQSSLQRVARPSGPARRSCSSRSTGSRPKGSA